MMSLFRRAKKVEISTTYIRMTSGYSYYVRGRREENLIYLPHSPRVVFRLADSGAPITLTVAHIEAIQDGGKMKVQAVRD